MWEQTIEIDYGHSEWEYDETDTIRCDICGDEIYDDDEAIFEIFRIICTSCNEIIEKNENAINGEEENNND